MYETDADRIKLEALRKKALAYDEESKRLKIEAENVGKSREAKEKEIESDLAALKVQNQTAEVLQKIINLTKELKDLKTMDEAQADEVAQAQKKNEADQLENQKAITDLAKKNIDNLRKWEADSLIDMAQNGKSFKDIMKNVWSSIGKDAIYGLMGITGQDSKFAEILEEKGGAQ